MRNMLRMQKEEMTIEFMSVIFNEVKANVALILLWARAY